MQTSGGYGIKWRKASPGETYRVDMGVGAFVDVPLSEASSDTARSVPAAGVPASAQWTAPYPSLGPEGRTGPEGDPGGQPEDPLGHGQPAPFREGGAVVPSR